MVKECRIVGCGKSSQHNSTGMCKAHFSAAKRAASDVAIVQAMELIDPIPPADFGKVTNAEGEKVSFGIDEVVYLALEDAWERKKQEWFVDLSGLRPGKAICYAAKMLEALEGLGY